MSNFGAFNQPQHLQLVCGNNLRLLIYKKGSNVIAKWPIYETNNRLGMKGAIMPPLTPYLGPEFYIETKNYSNRLDYIKDAIEYFLEELECYDFVDICIDKLEFLTAFIQKGYRVTSGVTYRLDDISQYEKIWTHHFSSKLRSQYNKAQKSIKLADFPTSERLYNLVSKTFQRQNLSYPHKKSFFIDYIDRQVESKSGKILIAEDEYNDHAGGFILWDKSYAYNLLSGGDPLYRNSDATSFIMIELIREASKYSKGFDFEGSTIPGVEKFYRSFGGTQTPTIRIRKESRKKRFLDRVKSIKKGF